MFSSLFADPNGGFAVELAVAQANFKQGDCIRLFLIDPLTGVAWIEKIEITTIQ